MLKIIIITILTTAILPTQKGLMEITARGKKNMPRMLGCYLIFNFHKE